MKPSQGFSLNETSSQMKYEANLFTTEYLLDDDMFAHRLSEDTFFFSVVKELEVPPELLDFKF
ncbi:hypothetical protein [Proteiniclasticum sp. QWL-01]|uniref:hypothetical protein n=1 Tax=Proteiniclasticum sp. QWL-01 TaxID=3036945 RepID=UPI0024113445|nr:hypothetical protein [Proteiniclasticum sp. QWL-01]WFF73530.1 hypothetical protein P6M73_03505 [Proteiniclasticum sp. QWL-01]